MQSSPLRCLVPLVLPLVAGCHSYDFAKARLPDGTYDGKKLMADLKASGEETLSDGYWIPLLHCDITSFGPTRSGIPFTYNVSHWSAYGPLFCLGKAEQQTFAGDGSKLEDNERHWGLWGIAYHDLEERIETKHGQRTHGDWRVALLFGQESIYYRGIEPTPK